MTLAIVALLGLAIGSFLNVVIVRLPERQSLLGRSACRHCGARIGALDNVPLLSFAALAGRCRSCRTRISWRYPLVEASTAAAFAVSLLRFGLTPAFALAAALLAALIAVTAIDLEHQIIPDAITLPGLVAGLAFGPLVRAAARPHDALACGPAVSVLELFVARPGAWPAAFVDALLGAIVCGGLLGIVIAISGRVYARRHPELPGGMGIGDMKLAAMLGAFLGWCPGLYALFVAVMAGGAVAAALLATGRRGRTDAVPFGPFLALGGAVALLTERPDFLGL